MCLCVCVCLCSLLVFGENCDLGGIVGLGGQEVLSAFQKQDLLLGGMTT